MKINQKELTTALQYVSRIARGSVVPIYGNVSICSENGVTRLMCRDGELCLVTNIQSDCGIKTTVDAKRLSAFVKNAKSDIVLDAVGDKLTAKSGRSKTTLSTMTFKDMPDPPVIEGETFVIDGSELSRMIQCVSHAQSKKDAREYLNGALLKISEKKAWMVATDGHRLAATSTGIDTGDCSIIIPTRTLSELLRLSGKVSITTDGRELMATNGDCLVHSKTIQGKYPDWFKVIPETSEQITFNRLDLIDAVVRCRITEHEKFQRSNLAVNGNSIVVTSQNSGGDITSDEIDANSSANNYDQPLNGAYLYDALNALEGDDVVLHHSGVGSQIKFTDSTENIHVLMPHRI